VADEEMQARVARHRLDRPANLDTVEAPLALGAALRASAREGRLLIVDCLTMWLTNWLMPAQGEPQLDAWHAARDDLLAAMSELRSSVVFVSNEIGWGVIPMSSKVRAFVDELGWLNQAVASRCAQVTLMVAGQAWTQTVVADGG
jgi:adenosylcobinamide kinase/adenosylcobinamide-phosphate guanylyltransferase